MCMSLFKGLKKIKSNNEVDECFNQNKKMIEAKKKNTEVYISMTKMQGVYELKRKDKNAR